MVKLAEVLEFAREARWLNLGDNPRIGRRGLAALAAALRGVAAPKLVVISVHYPRSESAKELRDVCEARGIRLKDDME